MDVITSGDGRTRPEHFDPELLAAFEREHRAFSDAFEEHATDDAEAAAGNMPVTSVMDVLTPRLELRTQPESQMQI